MQALHDAHRAPACKSCKGHRGVRHCCSRHHEGQPRLVPAVGGARQRTLTKMGGLCAPCPRGGGGGGSDDNNGGGGLTGVRYRDGTHRALGEPATGPWEGGGGRHVTQGAKSFRCAATPRVGGGGGGRRSQSLTRNPLAEPVAQRPEL